MARMITNFNARENEKMGDFKPIPAGDYLAEAIKSEIKDTKAGTGKYLQIQFEISEGDHAGKMLFERLNIINPNSQTVEIANKVLATICECAGVDVLEDSEELHGVPMVLTVKVKPATTTQPEQNDIKGYTAVEGASNASMPGKASLPSAKTDDPDPEAASKPKATSAGAKSPPWNKK